MFKTSLHLNGDVMLDLDPSDDMEKQLLAMMVNGREVKTIKAKDNGGVSLLFTKSEGKK